MANNFDTARAKAIKALGKDAKVPDNKALDKTIGDVFAAYDAFDKSRDDMQAKILVLQKALASHKLTMKQFIDKLDDEDFGLDEKNKDDAKKIKEAQGYFDDWASSKMDLMESDIDGREELDKHVIDFRKYKLKQTPG
jgi:hypothetical protein